MKRLFAILACAILAQGAVEAISLKSASPESEEMDSKKLTLADDAINQAIAEKIIPGAVFAVVRDDKLVYLKAYGNRRVEPNVEPMTTNTVFDLASVSKVVGTTIAVMQLVEQGKICLTDKAKRYIPGFAPYVDPKTGEKVDITIKHLLTHSSGLADYVKRPVLLEDYTEPYFDCLRNRIAKEVKRDFRPGTSYRYSCLNFISLQYVVEAVTGQRLCDYVQENVFDVLGLKHTCYNPTGEIRALCAPTSKIKGKWLCGESQDPLSRVINEGNSGNAGVFSTAEDLAVICAAILNGGELDGARILSEASVCTMATIPAENDPKVGRALGWDTFARPSLSRGDLLPPSTIYHTGYTGTEVVIDLEGKTAIILLTNRCHPVDKHYADVNRLRCRISNIVAGAIIE